MLVLRMVHRKWKETKQQPSMLPGPAVPGCCLVSFHILWAILSMSTVIFHKQLKIFNYKSNSQTVVSNLPELFMVRQLQQRVRERDGRLRRHRRQAGFRTDSEWDYRVTHLLTDLGWVVLALGCSHTQGIDKRRVESSLQAWGYAISGSDG